MENKIIYKYPLNRGNGDETVINIKSGSKLLHIDTQDDQLSVWFELPLDHENAIIRTFKTIYTGTIFDDTELKHIKTVVFPNRYFVVHIYEKITGDFLSNEEMTI